jgi:hypothetical protein
VGRNCSTGIAKSSSQWDTALFITDCHKPMSVRISMKSTVIWDITAMQFGTCYLHLLSIKLTKRCHVPENYVLFNDLAGLWVSIPEHRGQHFPGFLTGCLQETEHTFCVHILWPSLQRQRMHSSCCHSSPSWYVLFPAKHVLGGDSSVISRTVVRCAKQRTAGSGLSQQTR